MRIDHQHQLTYCTNIHPGANWESTFESLKAYVPLIKREVSPDGPFGLGLRLSNKASEELGEGRLLEEFKEWLAQHDLYVFTMNGFPYGNFHNERVKEDVHTPDWTTQERLIYTQRLFRQLAELLPAGLSGGISTSPISYKYWHDSKERKRAAFEIGAKHLTEIVIQLYDLETSMGRYLHLDIEPEPDGLLENTEEVIHFFTDYLLPIAIPVVQRQLEATVEEAEEIIKKYITVCYDICHFSLAYEEPEYTFGALDQAGIRVGKIQVSAALKILFEEKDKEAIWASLSRFDEPTYLHQVTEKKDGKVTTYNDLPVVLEQKKDFTELRAHFHVPIFLERFDILFSTQDHIIKVIDYIKELPVSEHLEIETYTWDVLPKGLKRELSESIIREINWLKDRF